METEPQRPLPSVTSPKLEKASFKDWSSVPQERPESQIQHL